MNELSINIKKIAWITIGWTLLSIARFVFAYSVLINVNCDLTGMDLKVPLIGAIITGLLAGILGGSGVVFLWEGWLRTKTYASALTRIVFTFSIIYFMVGLPMDIYQKVMSEGWDFLDGGIWAFLIQSLGGISHLESYFFWLSIVMATLIILQVSDKYGPGVFISFLMGKYFRPQREERIFMFLDLRSSTKIAEQLGEEKYFNFLNDTYRIITKPILINKGEIYQYVGDEIVVSWPIHKNSLEANCVKCFFDIEEILKQKKSFFIQKYNIHAEFKAGIHYGHVMAGEIGIVKRDIVFSGDVMNTTSRIQGKCNDLGVNILISHSLLNRLPNINKKYATKAMGKYDLRGKEEDADLYTVQEIAVN